MNIAETIFEWYHHRWHRRWRRRAATDPRWAEIEAMRDAVSGPDGTQVIIDRDHGITMDLFKEQNAIGFSLTPHTWVHRLHWWLNKHPGVQHPILTLRSFWARGRRGWSPRDTIDLDEYLARVIAESISHLRDTSMGYPGTVTPEEWSDILSQIIQGFALYADSEDDQQASEHLAAAMSLLAIWFPHLWS